MTFSKRKVNALTFETNLRAKVSKEKTNFFFCFNCRHSNDGNDWRYYDLRFLSHVHLRTVDVNYKKGTQQQQQQKLTKLNHVLFLYR